MTGSIDYGGMMHRAVQGLIAEVLSDVARDGLPGAHHFFISFETTHQGVEMAPWLHERYPETMTIVLQEWFEDLSVDADSFSVTLNFGNAPERLTIPFDAMRSFVDPSVEFGFRFDSQQQDEDDLSAEVEDDTEDDDDGSDPPSGGAEVVSLDRWRK